MGTLPFLEIRVTDESGEIIVLIAANIKAGIAAGLFVQTSCAGSLVTALAARLRQASNVAALFAVTKFAVTKFAVK